MGVALYYVMGVLGASFVGHTYFIGLTWFFCRQKAQEGLESCSFTHFLDGAEDKE